YGKICVVVPCDNITNKFRFNDPDLALYSFSPMNLGNILSVANFKVLESKPCINKWPPYYRVIQKLFGWNIFNLISKIYGYIDNKWWSVKIIAEKDPNFKDTSSIKKKNIHIEHRINRKKSGLG
ncbi:hypothetical protein OAR45_03805, partial [Candidatus Pelagibacter sp.]|nr:hypothetical protein [Candidatus Pelagibacter sp.]